MTGYTSLLVKTNQTTSYATGDDGDLQVGAARSFTVLDTGQYSGTTNITLNGNTDVHSNECVQDNVTGLMWSRNSSASVGPDLGKGSTGQLPWTTNGSGEGILTYAAAANAALLAGYGNDPNPLLNWRVPSSFELYTLLDLEVKWWPPFEFPTVYGDIWSSTRSSPANALYVYAFSVTAELATNATHWCLLVRGAPTAPPAGGNSLIGGMVG
jgi:hypothetical protein